MKKITKISIFIIPIIIAIIVLVISYPGLLGKEVHYEIGLSGIKEKYAVGEELKFSIYLNGFGSPCGSIRVNVLNGEEVIQSWTRIPACPEPSWQNLKDLKFHPLGSGAYELGLTEPGLYTVTAKFQGIQTTESFIVIEN